MQWADQYIVSVYKMFTYFYIDFRGECNRADKIDFRS